jgi:SAM-dependent methyltransferase
MNGPSPAPSLERWHASVACCDPVWEAAYRRFETPEEERAKFVQRLRALGAEGWPKDAEVAELCCGRGNGLRALETLGFTRLAGVDLSEELLASYRGPARLVVGDVRELRFAPRSLDLVIVQGGLHHLPDGLDDLERTLAGVRRVLRPNGRFVAVEPWRTPFLSAVLALSRVRALRAAWGKLDALAVMVEREHTTYFRWLAQPAPIRALLTAHFEPEREEIGWGRLAFVGRPRAERSAG